MEIAVLALGCFWGPEKKYGQLEGVYRTEVGYSEVIAQIQITERFAPEQQITQKL